MGFIKELWSDAIYQTLYEDVDLQTMFDRSYETLARQGGNKIHLPTLASGVALSRSDNQSVGSGLPRTPADISKSSLELSIYEYSTDPIVIRNLDVIQGDRALFNKNVAEVSAIIKEYIMTAVLTEIMGNVNSTHRLKWVGGAGGSKFSHADLRKMRTLLTNAKHPMADRFIALDPEAEDNLLEDDYLKNWLAVNQSNIQNGQMPMLAGFKFAPSTLVPKTKDDGTISATPAENTKLNAVAWKKNWVALVIQTEIEITGSEQAQYLGGVYAFTTRFGTKLVRDKAAVQKYQG